MKPKRMKVLVYENYGSPDELKLREKDKPLPNENEVLVKVKAVSLNASDIEFLRGVPLYTRMWGMFKPKYQILGSDFSGIVEAVGAKVVGFKQGDEVFGDIFERWGCLAEFVTVPSDKLLKKPVSLSFEEVAAIPQAAVVALQAIRDKGKLQKEEKVLINGAGGGAGTFGIQLAKLYGAEVTGVDNAGKQEFMRSLGADNVIDYQQEDFTQFEGQYDLIIDFVAYRSIFDLKKALKANGRYVMVGGALNRIFQTLIFGSLISMSGKKDLGILAHKQNEKDIQHILSLIEENKIRTMIDKVFPLNEGAEAFSYLGNGLAKGKVVIRV
ncbi:NAD(P)-dependent alcohol dehydrogenase [Flexithrix dorotheae]|uniref:NAD(P)-dependent alcohol dehydrogenase n=1 Tax=Flexithrix dorotheae TaxID=70993 RepID=UPI00037EAC24|nr:NAD(P)-dependent alcohol dehydrogenase [Flexithrix dorotheae]